MFYNKFKEMASIAEAVKKVMDEEDVEESGLRKAAHAAHSAGQSHFMFKGKKYPVRITKEHVDEMKEATGVTDYTPPSQGGTRKDLLAKYHKTKDPKDAEAARKAGATQNELKGKLPEELETQSEEKNPQHSRQYDTTMKHANNPTVQQRMAAHDIKPGVAGYRDRIAMLKDLERTGKLKKENLAVDNIEKKA